MKKQKSNSWIFLSTVILIYILIFISKRELFSSSINFFIKVILDIIPVFIFVFILMAFTNYYITPKFVEKHFRERGIKKWFFAIIGGLLSTGPIYLWYPFLSELKKKGLNYGIISCFLYNRAIMIPLLPIAIFYFGMEYVLTLSIVIIFMSVIQGKLINRIIKND